MIRITYNVTFVVSKTTKTTTTMQRLVNKEKAIKEDIWKMTSILLCYDNDCGY